MAVLTRRTYRKRRRLLKRAFFTSVLLTMFVTSFAASIYIYAAQLPAPSLSVPETTVLLSQEGVIIGQFHQGQNRHWIPLE